MRCIHCSSFLFRIYQLLEADFAPAYYARLLSNLCLLYLILTPFIRLPPTPVARPLVSSTTLARGPLVLSSCGLLLLLDSPACSGQSRPQLSLSILPQGEPAERKEKQRGSFKLIFNASHTSLTFSFDSRAFHKPFYFWHQLISYERNFVSGLVFFFISVHSYWLSS